MTVLVQKVSTGDVIVFDKRARELILVEAKHARGLGAGGKQKALSLVKQGKAQRFNRKALQRLQAALAGVVLLV